MPATDLSSNDLALLCGYLSRKTGMVLDELRRGQLGSAVKARMQALSIEAFSDYYQRLALSPGDDQEFKALMDLFTIKETSFFRHNEQFRVLKEYCLPRLMAAKSQQKTLRIWSAGCSFGEEPYSIAMVIRDCISSTSDWDVTILATDISQEALEGARRGIYQQRSVRVMEARYLKRYFTALQAGFSLSDEIKRMVAFDYFNLAADYATPPMGHYWDIIFCRNVIIYLSKEHIRYVLSKFHASLADEGYLFPGYSEILRYHSDDFVPLEVQGTFIYQKSRSKDEPLKRWKSTPADQRSLPPMLSLREAGKRSPPLKTVQADRLNRRAKAKPNINLSAAGASQDDFHRNQPVDTVAMDCIAQSATDRLETAKRLAEQDLTQQAVELLGEMLESDPLDVRVLNLLAAIWQHLKDLNRCIHFFKKSLYLDPVQPMVRLHLADAYRATGKITEARREYANVIAILETEPIDDITELLQGFSRNMILDTARSHLQALTDGLNRY